MSAEKKKPRSDPLSREVDDALEGVNLQELDEDGRTPERGPRKLKGAVVGVNGDDVFVELGPRMQGVLSRSEFEQGPEVGAVYEFSLHGQEEGLWILSRREARAAAAWSELAPGVRVEARVTGQNTGGLELRVGEIAAFMPASQVALGRADDLSSQIGRVLECQVVEVDPARRRVLLSRRALLEKERAVEREKSLGSLQRGQLVAGVVKKIEAFGAFVEIAGGLEGLLHVSNLSRRRVQHPSEKLSLGQAVQVEILEIQEGGRRIALSMKHLEEDPWQGAEARFPSGTVVSGKVVRVMPFGAFVELAPGLEGLIHVSQLGKERIRRAQDASTVGEEVSVRILSVDPAARRVALTRLDERGALLGSEESVDAAQLEAFLQQSPPPARGTNLGALFKKALGNEGRPPAR